MKRAIILASVLVLMTSAARAGQIGFEEEFALAQDRSEVLKQLVAGTEEYYYYSCLHYQNTNQLDKVDELLTPWIKRFGTTPRVEEIRNRQALLGYPTDADKSLAFIKWRLGLTFNHQQEPLDKKSNLPTQLDPTLIGRDRLTKWAMEHHQNLAGFEDVALDWLTRADLNAVQRRHLLERLERPDYPNLPQIVAADLATKESRGFGEFGIHQQMLLSQLDELLALRPALLNDSRFVAIYLGKLQPADGIDWRYDLKEHQAYLERLWSFASRLTAAHNSLKASILYRRLVFDRSQGVYDRDRFMAYLKLPRQVGYLRPQYLKQFTEAGHLVNLGAQFDRTPILSPVHDDEPLVRSYLMHFFQEAESYADFQEIVQDAYLKQLFAETKLVGGLGDAEKWISLITPSQYQALQERVDIDFAWTNKETFGPEEAVELDLYVKNVKTLIVKVYEVNARNFYLANGREVGTDINLDGLVPNEEQVETYSEIPLRRVKRHFAFPKLAARGVYVVEFIGNGKSSRALIRKGKLNYLVRTSVAGQIFTVFDEANQLAKEATLWMGGHLYTADAEGRIAVPFSTGSPTAGQTAILCRGDFASLITFQHEAEVYSLAAGIHVDRESLLARQKAVVLVRPVLTLNGTPVTLSVLQEVALVITSTDLDGVSATKVVSDFKLFEDRESLYEFRVPERLRHISFTLRAKVLLATTAKKQDLSASDSFHLNGLEALDRIENLLLGRADGNYVLDVLGKTGEPRAGRAVALQIKHRDFLQPVKVSLQTDAAGRITLGALPDIVTLQATGPEGTVQSWTLPRDAHSYAYLVQGQAGGTLRIPYMGAQAKAERAAVSLLEKRGDTFVADRFAALAIAGGMVEIKDLPAGEYSLLLKESGQEIVVRLAKGEIQNGYLLGKSQYLQVVNASPLQIIEVKVDDDALRISLANSSPFARVHVVATRYLPEYSLYHDLLAGVRTPGMMSLETVLSDYAAGRSIGDEYQYIINRKYATRFPGNMLARPGLLLNPWAVSKTETDRQRELIGLSGFGGGRRGGSVQAGDFFGVGGLAQRPMEMAGFASLDFLPTPAVVLTNLEPDQDGRVTIDRTLLGDRQQVHVLAIDPENTAYREVSLPERKLAPRDLRLLAAALDPKTDFSEQKQVSVVEAAQTFTIEDITSSRFELYDTLGSVYRLYATLSGDPTLTEFQFILTWPKMKPEEKREKYSKYACHELNLFLYHKDPEFFKSVILPNLANKKDKTFLDHWLVGDDLAGYLRPWQFEQLNVVERALLARRIKSQQAAMARSIQEQVDLLPPNIDEFTRLFMTALQGSSLEAVRTEGLIEARTSEEGNRLALIKDGSLTGARPAAPAETAANDIPTNDRAAGEAIMAKRVEAQEKAREGVAAARPALAKDQTLRRKGDALDDAKAYNEPANKEQLDRARQLYRKLDKTEEWAENNYYHLPIARQNAGLVTVNAFWNDYASADGQAGFRSRNLAEASRNFTEMMMALAVLDLPYEAAEHQTTFDGARMTMVLAGPAIVFHKQIRPAQPAEQKSVLVSQDFFRPDDRYAHQGNEQIEKYVTDEFLAEVIYGCHVVVTNPTSARTKLDVLLQVPQGSLPVAGGQGTRSVHLDLEPYRTQTLDYYFYFPQPGRFPQYPVHVAQAEKQVARVDPVTLTVVAKLSKIDTASWDYISQQGTEDDVLNYLKANNLNRINLDRIAWRARDKGFFNRLLALLGQRLAYNHTLWGYGLYHNLPEAIRQFLAHEDAFVGQCGAYLDTPLLVIDPVERKASQHLEYSPLVNARAHRLGRKSEIVNDRLYVQYQHLMTILRYRPTLDDTDRMAVTYYLLLQDRIEEGLAMLKTVDKSRLATEIQYEYFQAYAAFYQEDLAAAVQIARKYQDYPVDRWQKLFANVLAQADEAQGQAARRVDEEDRTQAQSALAASEANFDFKVEAGKITVDYQNVTEGVVNYYLMDIELMFSRQPFVQEVGSQFSFIRPNLTAPVTLPAGGKSTTFDLPKQFQSSNVLVEITAGGKTKSEACYSRTMAVQVIETYGQVKVTQESSSKPLAKVYVKVYARMKGGNVQFYKDGYTDLRGRFEYASLSTNELDNVERFALLILSDTDGAVVREAAPPKQ